MNFKMKKKKSKLRGLQIHCLSLLFNFSWAFECFWLIIVIPFIQGVSAVRLFPLSGHLLLSCSMDCKIKVSFGWSREESEVAQLYLTLCDPMDCSLPGSSVHGIFQARVLEWVAISFSRWSSQPRDQTRVSHIAGRRFTIWATREHLLLC